MNSYKEGATLVTYLRTKRDQKNPRNLFIKNCVLILTCLNFSHLQVLSIWCSTPIETFFSLLKTVFELNWFWCLLVFLRFLVSCLPHCQNVSLQGIFSLGKQTKKSHLGWDQVNREGRAWGSCHFWSKTAELTVRCGQMCSQIAHHEMGKCTERISPQKFTEAECSLSQQCQLVHGYRWVPVTLT